MNKDEIADQHRTKVIGIPSALPDASDMQMMNDLVNYGVHVTRDGERVDPMDFYAEPPK